MSKSKRNVIIDKIHDLQHLPTDWKLKPLADVAWYQEGPGLRHWQFTTQGMKVINVTNLEDGVLNLDSTERHISVEEFEKMYKHFSIENKDIVMASSGATYCKTAVVREIDLPLMMNTSVIRFKPVNEIHYDYLLAFLGSFLLKRQIDFLITGGAQPNFGPAHLKQTVIPIPSKNEQEAIAHILNLMDTVINKSYSLIARKELQKKWLVQNLLTGKKRLKGFQGEWKETTLGNLFERVTRKNIEGNTTVVTISAQRGFVRQTDFFNKNIASEITDNYFLVEKGEFCYNKSYSNGYPWGATKRLKDFDKAVVTTLYICFGLKNSQQNSGEYFEQFFDANLLDKGLMKIAHEGGRAHGLLNVTPSDFFSMKIIIPEKEEQTAIAQVLQAADKEIQLLKTKTEKLREKKKWLMQILLTGKKRLN